MSYCFKLAISLCLALLLSRCILYAQEPSKRETINWIVKKLNDYAEYKFENTKFYYEPSEDELHCVTSVNSNGTYTDLIVIKLKDIIEVQFRPIESELQIKTLGRVAAYYSRHYKKGDSQVTNELKFYSTGVTLRIDYDKESNLKSRFQAAFNRLFSFYQREKEAF